MAFPESHIILPAAKHTHTIIFVHGRGSDAHEFAEEFFDYTTSTNRSLLKQYEGAGLKWIFPCAYERMSTIFQEEQSEWFDIYSLTDTSLEEHLQVDGLRESIKHMQDIIAQEIASGIPAQNIILGGISQGYATAIHALMAGQHQLAGFVGMSGWLPFQTHLPACDSLEAAASSLKAFYADKLQVTAATTPAALQTPLFLSHSQDDNVVDIELGKSARDALRRLGISAEWHEYEHGEHWLEEPKGYDDLQRYLDEKLV